MTSGPKGDRDYVSQREVGREFRRDFPVRRNHHLALSQHRFGLRPTFSRNRETHSFHHIPHYDKSYPFPPYLGRSSAFGCYDNIIDLVLI